MTRAALIAPLLLALGLLPQPSAGQKQGNSNNLGRNDRDAQPSFPPLSGLTKPVKPASAPSPDEVRRFDPQRSETQLVDGRWWLIAGDVWLKDFGPNESDARKALLLIRSLGLNELAVVGKPQAVFEYFLIDGKPPMPVAGGLELTHFNPDKLGLKPHLDGWVIVEGQRPLFRFAERDQAERSLALIRQHRFDRVGYFGRSQRTLSVFFSSFEGQTRPPPVSIERPKLERPTKPVTSGSLKPESPAESRKPVAESRMAFDYRQLQVRKVDGEWRVMLGTHAFKSFGDRERDAREALKVIQFYRFTELYSLETEDPKHRFEYFLSQGRAPQGRMFGQETSQFNLNNLSLRQIDRTWWIVNAEQQLFSFANEAAAKQALDAIKKNRFDQVCYVGGKETGLMYFVRTR